jgi:hypothetical protein
VDNLLKAQLRSGSGRTSKLIKDRERVEAVVHVPGSGRLVLYVDVGGEYSLRHYPESGERSDHNVLAFGVMRD